MAGVGVTAGLSSPTATSSYTMAMRRRQAHGSGVPTRCSMSVTRLSNVLLMCFLYGFKALLKGGGFVKAPDRAGEAGHRGRLPRVQGPIVDLIQGREERFQRGPEARRDEALQPPRGCLVPPTLRVPGPAALDNGWRMGKTIAIFTRLHRAWLPVPARCTAQRVRFHDVRPRVKPTICDYPPGPARHPLG